MYDGIIMTKTPNIKSTEKFLSNNCLSDEYGQKSTARKKKGDFLTITTTD